MSDRKAQAVFLQAHPVSLSGFLPQVSPAVKWLRKTSTMFLHFRLLPAALVLLQLSNVNFELIGWLHSQV